MGNMIMDAAFRATQADYDEGYKDGHREGYQQGYEVGRADDEAKIETRAYNEGYADGQSDAERGNLTYADLWEPIVDEALDLLIRHFDREFPAVATSLREVMGDYNHPSRIWDTPKEVRK